MSTFFKMRNPGRAAALAALGAAIGWLAAWVILKYMSAPDESFFSFLYEQLNEGVRVIPRRSRHRPYQASGSWLMLGWILEALVIIAYAAIGGRIQANMKGLSEGLMTFLRDLSRLQPPRYNLFKRVPSVTMTVTTDRFTTGGFLTIGFDDGRHRSTLIANAYINDQAIKTLFRHFDRPGRKRFR